MMSSDKFSLLNNLRPHASQGKQLSEAEVRRLINLYTPSGFLEAYQRTGEFVFPYPVDHPLTPVSEVISNSNYHFYQKLI